MSMKSGPMARNGMAGMAAVAVFSSAPIAFAQDSQPSVQSRYYALIQHRDAGANTVGVASLPTQFELGTETSDLKAVAVSDTEFPLVQDEQSPPDPWALSFGINVMIPSINGELSIAETAVDVDVDFSDLKDHFDVIGFAGGFEAWKDDTWGIIFTGSYFRLDGTFDQLGTPSVNRLDVVFEQTTLNLGAGYRVYNDTPGGDDSQWPRLVIDAIGGARYQYITNEIEVDLTTTLGSNDYWVEPFVGARAVLIFNEKFSLSAGGDIGGFGIGDASELTWNFNTGVGYRVTGRTSLHAGYALQGLEYSSGSGLSQFGGDYTTQGITFSVRFMF